MAERETLKTGDGVRVRPFAEIVAALGKDGKSEGLPFMPEMRRYCGRNYVIAAIMTKICSGGEGMRQVVGEPLIRLEDLRCDGADHDNCSRLCTLLWKPSWLEPDGQKSSKTEGEIGPVAGGWPFRTRTIAGAYVCQVTALSGATAPITVPGKLRLALGDVVRGEWSAPALVRSFLRVLLRRLRAMTRRPASRLFGGKPTPVQVLALEPGEPVEVKSSREIAATLDRRNRNRGLEFSSYMLPYCGGRYRVQARVHAFIDERTGLMRELDNTVVLEGVTCGGDTTAGLCRRSECLYWREIWLRRVPRP